MKIIILVTTFLDNDIYSEFYKKQNETWNSYDVSGVKVYFNINDGNIKGIRDHFIINNMPESLINAASKLINCFEFTMCEDYDYIFHTNSSSYIDKELLYKWLEDKPRKNFYSGFIGNHNGIRFASGCGFTLSKDLVELALSNKSKWANTPIFDANLGKTMFELNVPIYPAPRKDFDTMIHDINTIPNNFFHYRCKSINRKIDIANMQNIFEMKQITKNKI